MLESPPTRGNRREILFRSANLKSTDERRDQELRLHRVIAGIQVLCVLLSSSGSHAITGSRTDVQSETIELMVEGREKVIGYVRDIKAKYKEDTPEYGEAKKKYRDALGK